MTLQQEIEKWIAYPSNRHTGGPPLWKEEPSLDQLFADSQRAFVSLNMCWRHGGKRVALLVPVRCCTKDPVKH
jgi:hypothetical protein